MSAFDTVYGSFVNPSDNFALNETLPAELPSAATSDSYVVQDPPVQAALATSAQSPNGISFSGALGALSSAANTGLGIFRQVQQIDTNARSLRAQQQIDKLNLEVAGAGNVAALELQRARTDAGRQVGIIQAQSTVDNARAAAVASRDGAYASKMAETNWPLLVGAGSLLYFVLKGAK